MCRVKYNHGEKCFLFIKELAGYLASLGREGGRELGREGVATNTQFGLLIYVVGTCLPRSVTSSNVEYVRHLKTTANIT